MERREFLRYSSVAAGALAFTPVESLLNVAVKKKYAHDVVTLGATGIKVSRLAMGTGTHGFGRNSNQTRKLGVSGLARLLEEAHDIGINFWDTVDQYGTHPHLHEALKNVKREKTVILTKTKASSASEMKDDLDRFRQELGTDYLDIVLLHLMTDPNWPKRKEGAMEVLERAREEGIIRAHGVSCHTLGALETAAKTDWVQVDLARINPARVQMDADVFTVVRILEKMHNAGKGIIGMKLLGAGALRDRVDECLRYALTLGCVDAFTIGQENTSEMKDLVKRIPEASIG